MEPFIYGQSTTNNGPLIEGQYLLVSDFEDDELLLVSLFAYNEPVYHEAYAVYAFRVKFLKSKENYVGERSYSPPAY